MRRAFRQWAQGVLRRRPHHPSHGARLALFALLLALAPAAHAERYRVDLILFLDKSAAGSEAMVDPRPPNLAGAVEPANPGALGAGGIELLPDDAFGLAAQWQQLRNSKRYQPLARLAWLQRDPPGERGPSLRLRWGAPLTQVNVDGSGAQAFHPVDGSVALLLGRYLHLDADLAYVATRNDGTLGSYRLKERRRMRRDELHYLDSPRLGVVARVQKAS